MHVSCLKIVWLCVNILAGFSSHSSLKSLFPEAKPCSPAYPTCGTVILFAATRLLSLNPIYTGTDGGFQKGKFPFISSKSSVWEER